MSKQSSVSVGPLSRRTMLQAGSELSVAAMLPKGAQSQSNGGSIQPLSSYTEVLATLMTRGRTFRVVGTAPDQSPFVAVKCGGTQLPATFISGGAHSTEHAGAVSL